MVTYRAVGADVAFVAGIRARADLDACHPGRDEKHPRLYNGALIPPAKLGTHRVSSHGSKSKLLSPYSGRAQAARRPGTWPLLAGLA
jgi:hypothetical protein